MTPVITISATARKASPLRRGEEERHMVWPEKGEGGKWQGRRREGGREAGKNQEKERGRGERRKGRKGRGGRAIGGLAVSVWSAVKSGTFICVVHV